MKKIRKLNREINFQKSFQCIPKKWISGTTELAFHCIGGKSPNAYGKNILDYLDITACIYAYSSAINAALISGFSNQRLFSNLKKNKASLLWQKVFFIEDAAVRLATFPDLIIWQCRLGFGIWDSENYDPIGELVKSPRSGLKKLPSKIRVQLENVHCNPEKREIVEYGNMLKHGWAPDIFYCHYWRSHAKTEDPNLWIVPYRTNPITHYNNYICKKLDLSPISNPKISKAEFDKGKFSDACKKKLIDHILQISRNVNNKFVELALMIDDEIDRLYKVKSLRESATNNITLIPKPKKIDNQTGARIE